jgi:hypothetical protein
MRAVFLVKAIFACASMFAETGRGLQHIPGLENECASIDRIYKDLHTLTRDGHRVVYIVNKEGIFEHLEHQLNIYKFCYDVNVELTVEQKAMLARYHEQKAHDAVGGVIREVPYQSPLYNSCAEQTGMVVETIACGLVSHPGCRDVLTGIAEYYLQNQSKKEIEFVPKDKK